LGVHIAAMGRSKVASIVSLVTLLIAAATCYLMINRWDALGAGGSIAVIYTVQMCLRLVCYCRLTGTATREVLLIRRNDMKYYRKLLAAPWSRIQKMRKQ
jgi:O-antigen/teichoic acid export membrane protein